MLCPLQKEEMNIKSALLISHVKYIPSLWCHVWELQLSHYTFKGMLCFQTRSLNSKEFLFGERVLWILKFGVIRQNLSLCAVTVVLVHLTGMSHLKRHERWRLCERMCAEVLSVQLMTYLLHSREAWERIRRTNSHDVFVSAIGNIDIPRAWPSVTTESGVTADAGQDWSAGAHATSWSWISRENYKL